MSGREFKWSTGLRPGIGSRRATTPSRAGSDAAMAATTHRPDDGDRPALLVRFDRVERAGHWVNAVLFLLLVAPAAILYLEPLQALVGRRALVEDIHVYAGLALPVPLVIALSG